MRIRRDEMKTLVHFFWLLFIALTILCSFCIARGDVSNLNIRKKPIILDTDSSFLIDDFSKAEGVSSIGTQWQMFTDRVMGGESTANSGYEVIDGRRCLRLQGSVSLENNGGFAQVALPLDLDGRFFDAGEFKGVRLWVWGNGERYHVHLRTNQTRLPWQYFGAEFTADNEWKKVEIPFQHFKPENLRGKLNAKKLGRIAIVAIKKEFQADIAVSRLEFYQ